MPKRLSRLGELAYNLWWTWQPEAGRLFSRLDSDLWERLGHNPIRLLREVGRSRLSQASKGKEYRALYDQVFTDFDAYMDQTKTWTSRTHPELNGRPIAYFSMEFGLHETLPIYSGGLGVLAGDHLKEASDLGLPITGVGFMYAQGYFTQRITEDGWQDALNNMLDFNNLPALPVFDDLPEDVLSDLAGRVRLRSYPAGKPVFRLVIPKIDFRQMVVEGVGVGPAGVVVVGGPQVHHHHGALGERHPTQLGVVSHGALDHEERRFPPQPLLDRLGQERAVAAHGVELAGNFKRGLRWLLAGIAAAQR